MIISKVELAQWLDYEKKKYGIGNCIQYFVKRLFGSEKEVIWSFQKLLRITEYHYNTNHKVRYYLHQMKLNHMMNKYGMHIGLNTCEKGLKIMHLGPILINGRTRIGEDSSIHINTAFVSPGVDDSAPQVGNDVVVGVGATIVGGVIVADHVAIGAGAVVCKDVFEENIAVAGVPAKKVSGNGKLSWGKGDRNQ